jgi:hypothetical protein
MPRKEAQLYLLDLCGSESQSYTEREEEVTCERCLAALRAGTGPASPTAPASAPGPLDASVPVAVVENGVLDRAVRSAVLKEREEVIEFVQAITALTMHPHIKAMLRQITAELKRRATSEA